jgi:hypothetical protein
MLGRSEAMMPVYKRELAFDPDTVGQNAGDWWHLVLDTETGGLYVEHTWRHASIHSEGETANGAQRFGINDFLMLAQDRPARPALMNALTEMFREPKQS